MSKLYKILSLFIPFYYIAIGCILFTSLFSSIDRGKRIFFGVFITVYGIFRIYRACMKTRDMT
jgi:hypothetical protein